MTQEKSLLVALYTALNTIVVYHTQLIWESREVLKTGILLDRFLKERCYQKVAGHVWFRYLPRYGALCRHARPPFTFHALTTPPVPLCFTLSSYNLLTNISKFMRFYLISLACTGKLSLLASCGALLTSTGHQVVPYVLAAHRFLPSSPLSVSASLSFFLLWSLFILSPRPFQYFYVLTEENSNLVSHAGKKSERVLR